MEYLVGDGCSRSDGDRRFPGQRQITIRNQINNRTIRQRNGGAGQPERFKVAVLVANGPFRSDLERVVTQLRRAARLSVRVEDAQRVHAHVGLVHVFYG